jgi:CRP-like cAMP-binding protein
VQQTVEFLSKVDLFREVKGQALERLAGQLRLIALSEGELFFKEDEPADGFYIIKSGMAKVTKWSTDSEGVSAVLSILRQGNSFGEIGLIDGLPRSAGVSAMGPVECYFLPRTEFLAALEENPEIALRMLPTLAAMVRNADQWVAQSI